MIEALERLIAFIEETGVTPVAVAITDGDWEETEMRVTLSADRGTENGIGNERELLTEIVSNYPDMKVSIES